MRSPSRPDSPGPDLFVWFFACLMLAGVVGAAFLLAGDISHRPDVRMVYLKPVPAETRIAGCGVDDATPPCLPDTVDSKLLVARR